MGNEDLFTFVSSLKSQALQDLIKTVKDWAVINGAAIRSKKNFSEDAIIHVPITLLPSPFPKSEFEKAVKIQPALNILINKIAHNHEFLVRSLKSTIEVDSFTKKIFDIYETVRKEGSGQKYSLGLLRSDYMVDKKDTLSIKQVEINTISVSLAGLAGGVHSLHRFVLERLQRFEDVHKLPENNALEGFCAGLVEAWKLYNKPNSVIVFVVEEKPVNICDHRALEFGIYRLKSDIIVLRRTFLDLAQRGQLNQNKEYFIDGKEVAVVYYRAGYIPDHYDGDRDWQVRLDIERSKAIKCPSAQYHLAGTKKIQQVLAAENTLSQFVTDNNVLKTISEVFTGLYSLDLGPTGDKAIEMALQNPEHFVLKPQREGGGHNTYGTDIPKLLSKIKQSKERSAYVLMSRITPPANPSYIVKPESNESMTPQDVVSELGIYGVVIGSKDDILMNTNKGHLLRTKNKTTNEGGVASGAGALDNPLLY